MSQGDLLRSWTDRIFSFVVLESRLGTLACYPMVCRFESRRDGADGLLFRLGFRPTLPDAGQELLFVLTH
jgi:hypothetical protein